MPASTAVFDEQTFIELSARYRRELQAHCYRLVGSVQDAEDLVQETLLAAWRGLDGFEGRASLRAWLYRIATNRCLNALRAAGRRPREVPRLDLPADAGAPSGYGEVVWLQPYPDALLDGAADDTAGPEARYSAKESIGLAFVSAVQLLPPRQRAVLVLRDVLGFRAAEVAEILETTEASVNSALQRARGTLDARGATGGVETRPAPRSPRERAVVGRFAEAFQDGDIDGVVALLTDDVALTMPPRPDQYRGRAAVGRFLATVPADGDLRRFVLHPTRANGQPAFIMAVRDTDSGMPHPHGIVVLTLAADRIAAITAFHDPALVPLFA